LIDVLNNDGTYTDDVDQLSATADDGHHKIPTIEGYTAAGSDTSGYE
jgi:hypothetical protein